MWVVGLGGQKMGFCLLITCPKLPSGRGRNRALPAGCVRISHGADTQSLLLNA